MRPIIALLTDFGTEDHYVGAMKGAALAACPEATLVDVTHGVPPHDVEAAACALAFAYRAFPGNAVFLAVVDPGVGSERRAIAVEAGGYRFVGPDNGLFTLVLDAHADARVHEVTNTGLFRHEVSTTFHGRDVFAPVAGHLARGGALDEVGPSISDPVRLTVPCVRAVGTAEWEGCVVHVDRFGNLTTNVSARELEEIQGSLSEDLSELVAVIDGNVVPLVRTYAEVSEGEPCALVGSSGRLEVAVNQGSAADVFGAARGAVVRLRAVGQAEA
jgi:S-adenosyl-L-methionine hydrolase (adenosine-forming)